MSYESTLADLAKFAIGTGVIGVVAKGIFNQVLARDLEGYRARLQADHAREIEQLKSEIRATAFEHETVFTHLHEKRVQVVAELYTLLARAAVAFESWMAPLSTGVPTFEEKAQSASDSATAFFTFFDENQIYFDKKLCLLILDLRDAFRRAWANFGGGFSKPHGKEWLAVWDKFEHDIPPIRTEIEDLVRSMLGVHPRG